MKTYEFGKPGADIVLIRPADSHDLERIENEAAVIAQNTGTAFRMIALGIEDWNRELSPWEAPPAFGREGFAGGAGATLERVLGLCSDRSRKYVIGGYSLAGLFALWAVHETDVFCGAAAASPSVWFPGFAEYLKEHRTRTDTVYLSLGDREEKTRNPVTSTVGDRIREARALFKERGVNCVLEWNEGNHFRDADIRTARAFAWVLNHQER